MDRDLRKLQRDAETDPRLLQEFLIKAERGGLITRSQIGDLASMNYTPAQEFCLAFPPEKKWPTAARPPAWSIFKDESETFYTEERLRRELTDVGFYPTWSSPTFRHIGPPDDEGISGIHTDEEMPWPPKPSSYISWCRIALTVCEMAEKLWDEEETEITKDRLFYKKIRETIRTAMKAKLTDQKEMVFEDEDINFFVHHGYTNNTGLSNFHLK